MQHPNFYSFLEQKQPLTQPPNDMFIKSDNMAARPVDTGLTTLLMPHPQEEVSFHESLPGELPFDAANGPHDNTMETAHLQGSSSRMLKGSTDFTRRKNWSERILVEMTGLVCVLSPVGKILYCSESTYDLTGYRPHEMVGESLTDFLHVDDLDVFFRDFNIAFETRSHIKAYYRIRKRDDSYGIFELVGQPKSDAPGEAPKSFFGIAQPMPTKNGILIDTFLELKMENEWLKWRIEELSLDKDDDDSANMFLGLSHSGMDELVQKSDPMLDIGSKMVYGPAEDSDEWESGGMDMDLPMEDYALMDSSLHKGGLLDASDSLPKDRWKRRKKHKGSDEFVCADCGTTTSPEWRKGPHGPKTLCNACGLRWAKKNKKKDSNED
ncbi:putative white collar 2 protein [Spinellus fusiger]|nr:putative white collar 2 protein [Spinellus fusiger]